MMASRDVVKDNTLPMSSIGTIFDKIDLFIGPETARKNAIPSPMKISNFFTKQAMTIVKFLK